MNGGREYSTGMPPISLHQQHRLDTTRTLIEAAFELFKERGFENTTVEDIAAKAKVSSRTFFRYFPQKELVVFVNRKAKLEQFRSLLQRHAKEHPPIEAVQMACVEMGQALMDDREQFLKEHAIVHASPALQTYELQVDKLFEDSIAEIFLTNSSESDRETSVIIAGALYGAMQAAIRLWTSGGGEADLVRLGMKVFSCINLRPGASG